MRVVSFSFNFRRLRSKQPCELRDSSRFYKGPKENLSGAVEPSSSIFGLDLKSSRVPRVGGPPRMVPWLGPSILRGPSVRLPLGSWNSTKKGQPLRIIWFAPASLSCVDSEDVVQYTSSIGRVQVFRLEIHLSHGFTFSSEDVVSPRLVVTCPQGITLRNPQAKRIPKFTRPFTQSPYRPQIPP